MQKKYYFDACTWRDHFDDRISLRDRPLGSFATRLLMKVIAEKGIILISDMVVRELLLEYSEEEVNEMFGMFSLAGIIKRVPIEDEQDAEARRMAKERNVPKADALNAILSRDNDAVLVTPDKHRHQLKDIADARSPEELL